MRLGDLIPWADTVNREYGGTIIVRVHTYQTLGYDQMAELAETFGTREITFEHEEGSGGGCESCGWGASPDMNVVYVRGATKNVEVPA